MRWLALLCVVLGVAPGLARAEPAVFVARAPGITAYLFGSIHVLKPGTEWRTEAVGRAFDAAGECWFELVLPPKGQAGGLLPFLRGIDMTRRLPGLLSAVDNKRLDERAAALHLPGGADTVHAMQPWMAWMVLEAAEMVADGMDPAHGVDQVLQEEAQADGKPVVGLETLDGQVGMLAAQPEAVTLRALHELLASPARAGAQVDALVRAWMAGDVDAVGRAMAVETRKEPELFRALLLDRNRAWAEKLAGLRGSGKVILVTVGAAHLAGPGNLRELLRARRFSVARVR